MVLTGVLRHYASVLMAPTPKKLEAKAIREQRALARGATLRGNYHVLSRRSFEARREALAAGYESGEFLKDPESKGKPAANPLSDPGAMDGMMGMMKNNMAMIIPNTLIMSWINAFFSGYVISMCSIEGLAQLRIEHFANHADNSETAVSNHHQVQEHAPGGRADQGYGPPMDVQY